MLFTPLRGDSRPGRFMATSLLQKVGFLMVFICPFRTYFGPGWLERSTTGIYFLVMVSDCVSCLEQAYLALPSTFAGCG